MSEHIVMNKNKWEDKPPHCHVSKNSDQINWNTSYKGEGHCIHYMSVKRNLLLVAAEKH